MKSNIGDWIFEREYLDKMWVRTGDGFSTPLMSYDTPEDIAKAITKFLKDNPRAVKSIHIEAGEPVIAEVWNLEKLRKEEKICRE